MKINVTRIRKMAGTTEKTVLSEFLSLDAGKDLKLIEPVVVDLNITNTGKHLDLNGKINAIAEVVCSRCLNSFHLTIDTDLHERFIHVSDCRDLSSDDNEGEVDYKVYESDVIVLDEIIIENLFLALPMQLLCKPDCQGLCMVCGYDLNKGKCNCKNSTGDPRLAILAKLKDELGKD